MTIPDSHYGVTRRNSSESALEIAVESITRDGFAIVDSGMTEEQVIELQSAFSLIQAEYIRCHGANLLESIGEIDTVRCPMAIDFHTMYSVATSNAVLEIVKRLILGKVVLNQQNLISNPPQEPYSQGDWHRDLPYQHFVSSTPLAINAIFCVDDFTAENGASFVLAGSHHQADFPSKSYIREKAIQLEAPRGAFIVMDCMTYHAGGFNNTGLARRAINQVYSIPFLKQQISLPDALSGIQLSQDQRELLGFGLSVPSSPAHYLNSRVSR